MTHKIKINYTDGNEIVTRINGNLNDISNYYGECNVSAWHSSLPQVNRIEFIESPYLDHASSKVYLFVDYLNNGLLQ